MLNECKFSAASARPEQQVVVVAERSWDTEITFQVTGGELTWDLLETLEVEGQIYFLTVKWRNELGLVVYVQELSPTSGQEVEVTLRLRRAGTRRGPSLTDLTSPVTLDEEQRSNLGLMVGVARLVDGREENLALSLSVSFSTVKVERQ